MEDGGKLGDAIICIIAYTDSSRMRGKHVKRTQALSGDDQFRYAFYTFLHFTLIGIISFSETQSIPNYFPVLSY